MGKIRIATIGSGQEEKLRKEQRVKREEKKRRREAEKKPEKVRIAGMKGGERIKSVGAETEEELEKLVKLTKEGEKEETVAEEKKVSKKKIKKRVRSQRYKQVVMKIDPKKVYSIREALSLLREISLTKFDETVELHINTTEKGLRGSVLLPYGTGKQIKAAIADQDSIDKIVEKAEKGKIDFDVLVAHPQVMPKLAKIAKILGPRGLMPNPKAGTISTEPEKVAEKFKKGEVNWKTESKFPIIHQPIGKLSFEDKQLEENFRVFTQSVGTKNIKNITLKSTMSPGIKVQIISQ